MKIVIIGSAYPLRGGGITSYNERLAREFQNQGHHVTIYTFNLQYPNFIFPGTTQYSTEPPPSDLHIKVKINSVNPFNWLSVGNELKNLKPDLIVVRFWLPFMGPALGTILRRVKRNNHTKIVCIADNVIPHEKRPGDKPFTQYFIKPIDAFITMSEKVLSDLRLFTQTKPARFVAHPLYDNFGSIVTKQEARKYLNIKGDEIIFLFFGFIRKYKGLDLLLEAVKILYSGFQISNFKLLIAGEFYEDRKTYDELITELNIKGLLILKTDFIPDSQVKYYLCAADAVVQPYKSATQSGVTPLAYHFEVPMIVTNVGGLPSLVPHNKVGLVCEAESSAIAEAMKKFMQTGADQFIPHLREEKKKYAWSNITEAILQISHL
jgi:glycosyltransferase involved in cell wall biosynthesis